MTETLEKRFAAYKGNIQLFQLAKSLIEEFGQTDQIPLGSFKESRTGFDEEDLLACCQLAEKNVNKNPIIH